MFSASSIINVHNLIYIEMSLIINFFPNKCLGCIVSMFLPLREPLDTRPCCCDLPWSSRSWRCHECPFSPLDLLINVIATPICGLIQMLPFELRFKCHKRCNAQTRFTSLIVNTYDLGQSHIFVICGCLVKGVLSVVGHAIHHLILEGFLGHFMVHEWVIPGKNWSTFFVVFSWMVTFAPQRYCHLCGQHFQHYENHLV